MGKSQRDKGAAWERKVANMFKAAGLDAWRTGMMQAQRSDALGDVTVTGVPLWIECKIGKSHNASKALEQAIIEAPLSHYTVAICKRDRMPATATCSVADLIELLGCDWPTTNGDLVLTIPCAEVTMPLPSYIGAVCAWHRRANQ